MDWDKMNRVIVLGAGASHGSSFSSQVDHPLPLVRSFLDTMLRLQRETVFHDLIKELLQRFYPAFNSSRQRLRNTDFEAFFSLLAQDCESLSLWPTAIVGEDADQELVNELKFWLDGLEFSAKCQEELRSAPFGQAFQMLSSIRFYMLQGLIAKTLADCHQDKLCEYHSRLAEILRPGDTIISFNYDLVMDQTLQRLRPDLWTYADGYGIRFRMLFDLKGQSRLPKTTNTSSVLLLKPHGSCNWITTRPFGPRGFAKPTTMPLVCTGPTYYGGISRKPSDAGDGNQRMSDSPLRADFLGVDITPPILSKEVWLCGRHHQIIWQKALLALARANIVAFIGYSMPQADLQANWLFRTGHALSDAQIAIIVDPTPERSLARFQSIYGKDRTYVNRMAFGKWVSGIKG